LARKRRKSQTKVEPSDAESSGESEARPKDPKPKKKRGSGKPKKATGAKAAKTRRSRKGASGEKARPDPAADLTDLDVDLGDLDKVDLTDLDADLPDLDEADARDRLIAEALAFVNQEDGAAEESRDSADPAAPDEARPADVGAEGVESTHEVPPDAPPDSPPPPTLSGDADAALKAIELEGGDGDPGEEVLDDLGEISTPEDRDRLLAAALAHAEMREATYRVPTDTGQARRWKGTIASVVFVIAMIVAASPPALVVPDPPAHLTDTDRLYGIRVTLLLQAHQVRAFRIREQRLPDSVADLAAPFPGVRFVKSNNRLYQLIAYTLNGQAIVYDSAAPTPEFEAIARDWAMLMESS
jgi:hypothetical protein